MVGIIICEVGTIICDIDTINVRFYPGAESWIQFRVDIFWTKTLIDIIKKMSKINIHC